MLTIAKPNATPLSVLSGSIPAPQQPKLLEQSTNQRNNCYVEVDGVKKTVAEWARDRGFHLTTLYRRYRQGIRGSEFLKPSVKKPKPITIDDIRKK